MWNPILRKMSSAVTVDKRTGKGLFHEVKEFPIAFDHEAAFREQQTQKMQQLNRDGLIPRQKAEKFRHSSIDSQIFCEESTEEVAGSISSAETSPIMSLLMRDQSEAISVFSSHEESLVTDDKGDKKGVAIPVPISPPKEKTFISMHAPQGHYSSAYSKPLVSGSTSEFQQYQSRKLSAENLEKLSPEVEYEQYEEVFDLDL